MFNFRIIHLPDGNQFINEKLKTPYNSLDSKQLIEYMETEAKIAFMEQRQQGIIRNKKRDSNPILKLLTFCGII